jgi:hypothetical protein
MASYNDAVALGVNAPDPNQSLNTLSQVLSMGQKGLAIQGQKSENISKAAQATVAQQSATENQNLAKLMSDPVGNGLVDGDGNPTKDAQRIVMQAAPTTGSQHYSDLVNAATNKVKFNGALNDLRSSERQEVLQNYAGAAAGADSPDDIKAVGAQLLASKKGTPEEGNYRDIVNGLNEQMDLMTKHQNMSGKLIPPGQELWRSAVLNATRAGLPEGQTVGPGGLATPQQAQTGAGTVNRNPLTGAISQPPGAPTGSAINPTPPQVAGQTLRQTGTAGGDVDRMNQVSSAVKGASAAIPLTTQVDDLAEQIHSGKFAAAISNAAAAVGMSADTYARQELRKNLGQIKTAAIAGPAGGSDSRASVIESGFPDETSDPQTIHKAMDYARGSLREDLARGNNLNQYRQKHPDLSGFQTADDILTSHTDPLMHEFKALPPAQQAGFYRRNFSSPQEAQAFKNKVKAADHTGLLGQ